MFDCITAIDPPPSESSWAQFVQQRSALLDQALTESVVTGKLADVELYAYTKRSHVGTVHTPVAVNARASLLESASPTLKGEPLTTIYILHHSPRYLFLSHTSRPE